MEQHAVGRAKTLVAEGEVEVRADGLEAYPLETEESLLIKRSTHTFNLVHLQRHDYFATLRTKLGWSGKLR